MAVLGLLGTTWPTLRHSCIVYFVHPDSLTYEVGMMLTSRELDPLAAQLTLSAADNRNVLTEAVLELWMSSHMQPTGTGLHISLQ